MNQYIIIIAVGILTIIAGLAAIFISRRRANSKKPLLSASFRRGGLLGITFSKIFELGSQDIAASLEQALIEADVGISTAGKLLSGTVNLKTAADLKLAIKTQMKSMFVNALENNIQIAPWVIVVAGVNGAGKTTTIAKLANRYIEKGKSVLVVAADTYRAAAVGQLQEWGRRLNMEVVAQPEGAEPAAVAFAGVSKACAKKFDVVIIDTAGRLHTNQNLMDELGKVVRVIGKACPGAPHEKLIVLDATVGSNGLTQAKIFNERLNLTGCVIAKMDGTAKGGVILAIADELKIPIKYVGVGEKVGDLVLFNKDEFVDSLFGDDKTEPGNLSA